MPTDLQDIEDAEKAYVLNVTKEKMQKLGNLLVSMWEERVKRELPDNQLRKAYIARLQVINVSETSVTFGLPGGTEQPDILASVAEKGMDAYVMNESLTRNAKRVTKDGKPMAFIPMGKTISKIQSQARPELFASITSTIKAITGSTAKEGGGTQWGGRLGSGFGIQIKPSHADDALAGLMRMVAGYKLNEATGKMEEQSKYRMFRTVVLGGKPWERRPTAAANIGDKVENEDAPRAIDLIFGGDL